MYIDGIVEINFGKNQKLPDGYWITRNTEALYYVLENAYTNQATDFDDRFDARRYAIEHDKKRKASIQNNNCK